MEQGQLFTLALGLVPPWMVVDVNFKLEAKRLDLHIDFPKGIRFACPSVVRNAPYTTARRKCGGIWIFSSRSVKQRPNLSRCQRPKFEQG